MASIELTVKQSLDLQQELAVLLTLKAPIKLKFELTELMIKTKVRNEAAQKLIEEIVNEYGAIDNVTKQKVVKFYADAEGKEKTEGFKQIETVWEQKINLDYEPISIKLFENIESDMNFPNLFKLLTP